MLKPHTTILFAVAICGVLSVVDDSAADEGIDFETQVRPLLMQHCSKCHGADVRKSGLRLDAKHTAFNGGDSGAVIVAGDSGKSELVRRITSSDPDVRMPPAGSPPTESALSSSQIQLLTKWIDAGAHWPETEYDRAAMHDPRLEHWAWQPLQEVSPPATSDQHDATIRNDVDRFILKNLQEKQLTLSPPADRRAMIRRLAFDLHGLPPSISEVDQFVSDPAPDAFERLVDRMLASPRYGERWARHWLDIAHYADTHGFERDQRRDHAWHYRDWVIRALNADMPYDQFLRDQIAGDVLRPDDKDAIAATGFLAAGPWDFVGQSETPSPVLKRLARADDLDDMVTQVMTASCGITINCARCHDHKLDPISQREYYSLWSVFSGVKRGDRILSPLEQQQVNDRRRQLEQRLIDAKSELAQLEGDAIKQQIDDLKSQIDALPVLEKIYAVNAETPATVHILLRGDPEQPGEEVHPGTISCVPLPASFGTSEFTDAQRRTALADWITSPKNPLTARVIVNRIWHHHFGVGLVDTPSDFGLGGSLPSHPELLDWLAIQLHKNNWSMKSIHRLICLSATWQQASTSDTASLNVERSPQNLDAGNRLLWRQNSRRLDAESLRDAVLAVSGKLNVEMFGPGYRDFDYKEEYAPVYTYITADEPSLWRRSIYRFVVRTSPDPFLTTLDCPNAANLSPTRNVTTTALQSLAMLNNEFMLKQSGYFAARLAAQPDSNTASHVTMAFQSAFGRKPTAEELNASIAFVDSKGLTEFCRALFNANEFVYID